MIIPIHVYQPLNCHHMVTVDRRLYAHLKYTFYLEPVKGQVSVLYIISGIFKTIRSEPFQRDFYFLIQATVPVVSLKVTCYKPGESLWPCESPHMATVTGQVSHPWPCEFDRSDMYRKPCYGLTPSRVWNKGMPGKSSSGSREATSVEPGHAPYLARNITFTVSVIWFV